MAEDNKTNPDETDGAAQTPVDASDPVSEDQTIVPETLDLPEDSVGQPEPVAKETVEKRGVFIPAVAGGIIAAAFGFFAAKTDLLDRFLPASKMDGAIATLEQAQGAQSQNLTALQDQVAAIKMPDLSDLDSRLTEISTSVSASVDDLTARFGTLDARFSDLTERLTALEKRPISEGVSQSAIEAYENELTRLQDSMAQQRAEVEALIETARTVEAGAKQTEAEAGTILRAAANAATLAALQSAMDSGSSYAEILGELDANGMQIPEGLREFAASGVATLASLQDDFPDAARQALAASRAGKAGSDTGVGAFFRRHLGARSVSPRDGTDADAVLSRAENALTNGQIGEALQELSTLSEPAAAEMGDWVDLAATRLAALNAIDAMMRELNTN